MRTSFHHQPEAQHPNFQLSTSWSADYPIFRGDCVAKLGHSVRMGSVSFDRRFVPRPFEGAVASLAARDATLTPRKQRAAVGGARQSSLASRLRFCAIAVSSTSSLAPL